jgi:glutathione peroxidase
MTDTIYDFEVNDLAGKPVKLADYKGRVLMIVNIASRCGQTPQLKGLEELYDKYNKQGFEILAFPSNDFMQEPKEGNEIAQFCQRNYGVKFRIFEKGHVRGNGAIPLYKYLAGKTKLMFRNNYPIWNFQKYIIDRNGRVVDFFNPWRKPNYDKIAETIEKCLAQTAVNN